MRRRLSRHALLLSVLSIFYSSSHGEDKQNDDAGVFTGRLTLKPAVCIRDKDCEKQIIVKFAVLKGGKVLEEFPLPYKRPGNFKFTLSPELHGEDVTIKVVVDRPEEYVPLKPQYKKVAGAPLVIRETITLKTRDSCYVEHKDYAQNNKHDEKVRGEVMRRLQLAQDCATTIGQKMEIFRTKANIRGIEKDWQNQQETLQEAYKVLSRPGSVQDAGLNGITTTVYFQERYDGFLEWIEYLKLRQPKEEFGAEVQKDGDKLKAWRLLVKDFSKEYPEASIDSASENINRERTTVSRRLERDKGPDFKEIMKAETPEKKLQELEREISKTNRIDRLMELFRLMGQVHGDEQKDWEEQQKVLAKAGKLDGFGKLRPDIKKIYFQERFDGFQKLTKYNEQTLPKKRFGERLLASNGKKNLELWKQFVTDLSQQYMKVDLVDPSSLNEEQLYHQLDKVQSVLGRCPKQEGCVSVQ